MKDITIISLVIQAIATLALVYVTFVLAKHTRTLALVTKKMVGIEEERDKRTQTQIKFDNRQRLIALAEEIVPINAGEYGAGLFPEASHDWEIFKKMKNIGLFKIYFEDKETDDIFEKLISFIQTVDSGKRLEESVRIEAINLFEQFQKKLSDFHINVWRQQLEDIVKS